MADDAFLDNAKTALKYANPYGEDPEQPGLSVVRAPHDIAKLNLGLMEAKAALPDAKARVSEAETRYWKAHEEKEAADKTYKENLGSLQKMSDEEVAAWHSKRQELELRSREAQAALSTARDGISAGPFVENTSDWVDLALKSQLIDASRENIDRLYMPTGDAVRSYTYGDEGQSGFYGGPGQKGIVPTRMQEILKKHVGKEHKIGLDANDDLNDLINGDHIGDDETMSFPFVELTPAMRDKIKEQGLPIFNRVGGKTSAAGAFALRPDEREENLGGFTQ